jgi:hypothetical protein
MGALSAPASRPSTRLTARELHRDQRGAVMLIGLCMSCFLIGSLWFIIGIGDAIVYRDFMQEATDHATFTSAVFHAKGMNFISAINLIIMALIIVHIILGIIHDILLLVCIATVGFGCGAYVTARRIYTTYSKFMKPVAGGLHYVEVAASYAYPILAVYKGYTVGQDYGEFGPKAHKVNTLVLSPSLLPGGKLDGAINKLFTGKSGSKRDVTGNILDSSSFTTTATSKKMLPVQAKKFSDVCDTLAKNAFNAIMGLTGMSSNKFFNVVASTLGGVLKARYCNDMGSSSSDPTSAMSDKLDKAIANIGKENAANAAKPVPAGGKAPDVIPNIDKGSSGGSSGQNSNCLKDGSTIDPGFDKWWGCEGPLVPWTGTQNGSPWQEVWGINVPFNANYKDAQENKVALAGRKYGTVSKEERNMYFAEAEFYFDCKKKWTDDECNKDDNAGYSIQWRARMKRLQFPEVGTLLASYAGQFLAGLKVFKDITGDFKKYFSLKDPFGNAIPAPLENGGLGGLFDGVLKEYVVKPIQAGTRTAGGLLNFDLGAYH